MAPLTYFGIFSREKILRNYTNDWFFFTNSYFNFFLFEYSLKYNRKLSQVLNSMYNQQGCCSPYPSGKDSTLLQRAIVKKKKEIKKKEINK